VRSFDRASHRCCMHASISLVLQNPPATASSGAVAVTTTICYRCLDGSDTEPTTRSANTCQCRTVPCAAQGSASSLSVAFLNCACRGRGHCQRAWHPPAAASAGKCGRTASGAGSRARGGDGQAPSDQSLVPAMQLVGDSGRVPGRAPRPGGGGGGGGRPRAVSEVRSRQCPARRPILFAEPGMGQRPATGRIQATSTRRLLRVCSDSNLERNSPRQSQWQPLGIPPHSDRVVPCHSTPLALACYWKLVRRPA
jgi:hypothetical protein